MRHRWAPTDGAAHVLAQALVPQSHHGGCLRESIADEQLEADDLRSVGWGGGGGSVWMGGWGGVGVGEHGEQSVRVVKGRELFLSGGG